jgi:FMN phosphatase YigB (HAD superfamily)
VILSNVHRDGFAASNRKLGVEFDAIYTAQDVGSYKPAPANFEYLLTHLDKDLGLSAGDVLHTAQSLHHDHVQARAFGLANAWIDRQGLSKGGDWGATASVAQRPETDYVFYSMMEMAEAVQTR